MGNVNFGVNEAVALRLRDAYGIQMFVETGTWKAGTALWAAEHFKYVVTVEGDRDRYTKTLAALGEHCPENLSLIQGDSRTTLARVLAVVDSPALLFLDAHWCGGGAAEAYLLGDECPLREELDAVLAHEAEHGFEHFIMIDDARLFTAPPPYPHDPAQWPTFSDIVVNLAHKTVFIHDDVIYALPDMAARRAAGV